MRWRGAWLLAAAALPLTAAAAPSTAAPSASAQAASLCGPDEPVRFSCRMARSENSVSICDGPGHPVYRFGTRGRVALALPDPAAPSAPYLLHEPNSGAEVKGVAFPRGDHTYVVMHFLGGRPATEELSISVQRNGSPTALLKCATRPAPVGDLPALFEQLRAGGMRVVQP